MNPPHLSGGDLERFREVVGCNLAEAQREGKPKIATSLENSADQRSASSLKRHIHPAVDLVHGLFTE